MENIILQGDALEKLKELPDQSVNMCMTSPPYWALRDYGVEGQLGLEPTFDEYINKLCNIFDEVKRVLRDDGTCWVNLGDTYYTKSGSSFIDDNLTKDDSLKNQEDLSGKIIDKTDEEKVTNTTGINKANELRGKGLLQDKNLTLIPFRFALEMQNRGWILRNTIIWHKRNCMPCSVKDRFTVDFEYIFFFSKKKKYYFETQREPHKQLSIDRTKTPWNGHREPMSAYVGMDIKKMCHPDGRNKRTVWTINPKPFKDAHFAVYPEELCETPIKAGCPEGGIVLDPFFGAGTTGLVALKQKKKFIGVELNPEYIEIINKRLKPYLEQTTL